MHSKFISMVLRRSFIKQIAAGSLAAGNDPFVAILLPVNPIDEVKPDSFVKISILELLEKDYALLGMKSMAGGGFFSENEFRWKTDSPAFFGS